MSRAYWAAAVQMNSRQDKLENLAAATRLVEVAARRGAELVTLPELFNCLGRPEEVLAQAESIPGETSEAMSRLAARLNVTLLAGSICERSRVEGKGFNTSLLFGPAGELLASYRKSHLFDVDLPDGVCCRESAWLLPGEAITTAATPLGNLGLSICYDLRFPELFRELVEAGMEILLAPSAFTLHTGRDHWEVLLRARAIENQVFVIATNQFGRHTPELTTYGRSTIIDPWGIPLAIATDGEGIILAHIDRDRQTEIRRRLPALDHRRGFRHD